MNAALPPHRRTLDVPTTAEQAQASIDNMINSTLAMIQELRQNQNQTVSSGLTQIVSAPKPPEFSDKTPYDDYRGDFRFYIRSIEPSTAGQITAALTGLMASWKDRKKAFIRNVDPASFIRPLAPEEPQWRASAEALLAFAKTNFAPIRALRDSQEDWIRTPEKMSREKWKTAEDFYLAFQTHLLKVQDRAESEADKPGQREVTRIFVACLPEEVRMAVEPHAPDLLSATYDTYRFQIAQQWYHYQGRSGKIHVAKRSREDDSEDEAKARPIKRPFSGPRTIPGKCAGSWETAPRELQGSIKAAEWMSPEETKFIHARWKRVKDACVCARCRLPKNKHPLQDTFQPVAAWEGPRVRETITEEEEELSEREE